MFGQSKLTDDIRPVKLRFWQENGLGYNAMGAVQVLYQNALGETRWTNQYGAGPSNKPTCEINVPYDDPIVQVTIRSGNCGVFPFAVPRKTLVHAVTLAAALRKATYSTAMIGSSAGGDTQATD